MKMNYKSPLQRALVINDNDISIEYQKSNISSNTDFPLQTCISVISGYETYLDEDKQSFEQLIPETIGIHMLDIENEMIYSNYPYNKQISDFNWFPMQYANMMNKIKIRPATYDEILKWQERVSKIYDVYDISDIYALPDIRFAINKGHKIINKLEPIE